MMRLMQVLIFLAVLLLLYIHWVPVQKEKQSLDKGCPSSATALTDTQIAEALADWAASLLARMGARVASRHIRFTDETLVLVYHSWIIDYCATHPQHNLLEAITAYVISRGPLDGKPGGVGQRRMTLDELKKLYEQP